MWATAWPCSRADAQPPPRWGWSGRAAPLSCSAAAHKTARPSVDRRHPQPSSDGDGSVPGALQLRRCSQSGGDELVDWAGHGTWIPMTRMDVQPCDPTAVSASFTAFTAVGRVALEDRMQVIECTWDEERRRVGARSRSTVRSSLGGPGSPSRRRLRVRWSTGSRTSSSVPAAVPGAGYGLDRGRRISARHASPPQVDLLPAPRPESFRAGGETGLFVGDAASQQPLRAVSGVVSGGRRAHSGGGRRRSTR